MSGSRVLAHVLAPGVPGGPLVVFAHGLEDAWTSWLPVAGELDPRWRLVALDLPWRPGNDYRWRARPSGRWLAEALDLVGDTPDVLVAHSYGAGAALQLLCRSASLPARSAMLVCPVYRLPDHPVSWRLFDRSRAKFDQNIRDSVRARVAERAATLGPGVLETMMNLALERVGPTGFLTVFEQFAASGDLPLGEVRVPALVLAGGADPTLNRKAASVLVRGMPLARLHVDDEYDHFCHIRHAGGVAAHVGDLVEAVRTLPRTVE